MRTLLLILLLSFGACPASSWGADDGVIDSHWHGVLSLPNRQIRFAIAPPNDAERERSVKAVLISLDEGGLRLPMDALQQDDMSMSFSIKLVDAKYEGEIDDAGSMADGVWKQRGASLPLRLLRVEQIPPRPVKRAWKGTINAVVQKLEVAFVELESGELQFDTVTQRAGGFSVEGKAPAAGKAAAVEFKVPAVKGVFSGELSSDGAELKGKWRQGLFSLTLNMQRIDPAELASGVHVARPRPQTPRPPFPYEVQRLRFPAIQGEFELAGTLTIPREDCVAAVVLITGSGPQDRDETILEHKPFWVLADHFARHGIATLRYDDRGVGESGGDPESADTHAFSQDAEAAFERLRDKFPDIPVGLCGHSEGGLIAPLVAARNKEVDFLVLLAGPGLRGDAILKSQLQHAGLTPLLSDEAVKEGQQIAEAIDRILSMQRHALTALMAASDDAAKDHDKLLREIEQQWLAAHPDAPLTDAERKVLEATIKQLTRSWFHTFLRLDPRVALGKVTCPVLALNGAKDVQVAAEPNIAAIRAALPNHAPHKFIIYPELNHLFQKCQSGAVDEYAKIEETFNVRPLNDIVQWIHDRAAP